MSEILTTLWLKFKTSKYRKYFSAYLQIEVLIAVSVLSLSVAGSALGVNSYRKQYSQLSTKRHLARCVEELAEHIELIYPQWKASQSYSATHSSPLSFLALEQYTLQTSLAEIVGSCSMEMPLFFSNREVSFLSGSKEIVFGDIRVEQVYFYCYTKIHNRWMYACVMKSYVLH